VTDSNDPIYEGLFMFNLQEINGELSVAVEHLREILARAEAEVVSISRWDERKLAYPIKGQKRALFLLTVFHARSTQIANIDRDVNLSELLLRAMIVRGDHLGEVELDAARAEAAKLADQLNIEAAGALADASPSPTPATPPEPEAAQPAATPETESAPADSPAADADAPAQTQPADADSRS